MKQEKNKFVLTQDEFDTSLEQEPRKEVLDMKEAMAEFIARVKAIDSIMNNANVTLSEEEIYNILEQ